MRNMCKFRNATCYKCHKEGHISTVCRSSTANTGTSGSTQQASHSTYIVNTEECCYSMLNVHASHDEHYKVRLLANGSPFAMEVDTGARVSIISQHTLKAAFANAESQTASINVRTYTGHYIPLLGTFDVNVQHGGPSSALLPLIVVEGDGPPLLGRNWLKRIQLNWQEICKTQELHSPHANLFQKCSSVFSEELGKFTGPPARIHVEADAVPKFYQPSTVFSDKSSG